MLISPFNPSIKHLEYMQEIGQNSHNNIKIQGLKQIIRLRINNQQNQTINRFYKP